MGGGAWPFLVGGVICLVNSDNERDLSVLNSHGFAIQGEAKGYEAQAEFLAWIQGSNPVVSS